MRHLATLNLRQCKLLSGFRFPIPVSDSGFRFRFPIPVSGFRFRIPFPDSVSGFRFPDSGFRIPDSGFRIPDSGFWFPDSGSRVRRLCIAPTKGSFCDRLFADISRGQTFFPPIFQNSFVDKKSIGAGVNVMIAIFVYFDEKIGDFLETRCKDYFFLHKRVYFESKTPTFSPNCSEKI
jgi:hypothetical protein